MGVNTSQELDGVSCLVGVPRHTFNGRCVCGEHVADIAVLHWLGPKILYWKHEEESCRVSTQSLHSAKRDYTENKRTNLRCALLVLDTICYSLRLALCESPHLSQYAFDLKATQISTIVNTSLVGLSFISG